MGQKKIKKTASIYALDTNVFVYHFEKNKKFFDKTFEIFSDVESGKTRAICSTISLVEILTHPKKERNYFLLSNYKEIILNFPNLTFVEVNLEIADLASSIRAKYKTTTPDAIVAATAIYCQADYLITADKHFKKIVELKVKLVEERNVNK